MTAYRTSDKPASRVATIAVTRSQSWWAGITFGTLFAAIGTGGALSLPFQSRLACTRPGSCTYVERELRGNETTRWDVSSLRSAHVEPITSKGHTNHRLVVVLESGRRQTLFDDIPSVSTQDARARAIVDFVADPARQDLFVEEDARYGPVLFMIVVAIGGALAIALTMNVFPARRVLLDEASWTARFERRAFLRWKPMNSVSLEHLDEILAEIAGFAPEVDDAPAAVRAFLDDHTET